MENLEKKHTICEICGKEIIGEITYFEDGMRIHSEEENPECLEEAKRIEYEMYPSK